MFVILHTNPTCNIYNFPHSPTTLTKFGILKPIRFQSSLPCTSQSYIIDCVILVMNEDTTCNLRISIFLFCLYWNRDLTMYIYIYIYMYMLVNVYFPTVCNVKIDFNDDIILSYYKPQLCESHSTVWSVMIKSTSMRQLIAKPDDAINIFIHLTYVYTYNHDVHNIKVNSHIFHSSSMKPKTLPKTNHCADTHAFRNGI